MRPLLLATVFMATLALFGPKAWHAAQEAALPARTDQGTHLPGGEAESSVRGTMPPGAFGTPPPGEKPRRAEHEAGRPETQRRAGPAFTPLLGESHLPPGAIPASLSADQEADAKTDRLSASDASVLRDFAAARFAPDLHNHLAPLCTGCAEPQGLAVRAAAEVPLLRTLGLREGDVLMAIDDHPLGRPEDPGKLARLFAGEEEQLTVVFQRGETTMTVIHGRAAAEREDGGREDSGE